MRPFEKGRHTIFFLDKRSDSVTYRRGVSVKLYESYFTNGPEVRINLWSYRREKTPKGMTYYPLKKGGISMNIETFELIKKNIDLISQNASELNATLD